MSVRLWRELRIGRRRLQVAEEDGALVVDGYDLDAELAASRLSGRLVGSGAGWLLCLLALRHQLTKGSNLGEALAPVGQVPLNASELTAPAVAVASHPLYLALAASTTIEELREEVAGNANCPSWLVVELMEDESDEVRSAIASRPDLSEEQLWILARDRSAAVRREIASRAELPTDLETQLAGDVVVGTRMTIARQTRREELMQQLAEDHDPLVAENVARNLHLTEKVGLPLTHHPNTRIRVALAANQQLPPVVLEALLGDPSPRVRGDVARRQNVLPEALMWRLQADPDPTVRVAVASRDDLPAALLEALHADPDERVRGELQPRLNEADGVWLNVIRGGRLDPQHEAAAKALKMMSECGLWALKKRERDGYSARQLLEACAAVLEAEIERSRASLAELDLVLPRSDRSL